MLVDRKNLTMHTRWITFSVVMAVSAVTWYGFECLRAGSILGGGSRPGLVMGIAGALIICFEMLLWPRKKLRAWRIGRTQIWMRAHIWLGLLCVPLVILHAGFSLGGQLSTVLSVLFLIVIASGVVGLILQNIVPRILLESIPAETIYSQINVVSQKLAQDAARKIDLLCPRSSLDSVTDTAKAIWETPRNDESPTHVVIGAVRTAGSFRGKILQTASPPIKLQHADVLREAFERTVHPFLVRGTRSSSVLTSRAQAGSWFSSLREKVDDAAHPAVDELEALCEQRRQFAAQAKLHWLLHGWIAVHVPLSLALFVILLVHIFEALRYW